MVPTVNMNMFVDNHNIFILKKVISKHLKWVTLIYLV